MPSISVPLLHFDFLIIWFINGINAPIPISQNIKNIAYAHISMIPVETKEMHNTVGIRRNPPPNREQNITKKLSFPNSFALITG